jgi:hypothetical protein
VAGLSNSSRISITGKLQETQVFSQRAAFVLALVFVLFAPSSWAFLDPPTITPVNPTVGDAISVSIYGGQCDLVHDGVVWPPPVTQQGNEITILFTGFHETNPELCYFGIGTVTYAVGSYPAGSYTLQVDRQYFNFAGALAQETLGVIPFTVLGVGPPATPVAAPTLGVVASSVLLLVLAGFAVRVLCSTPSEL